MQLQNPGSQSTGQRRTDQHTDAGQRHGWPETHAEILHPGAHTTIEQNNGQRQAANDERGVGVFELDTANTIDPGKHADDQKDQQQWNAQPR